MALVITMAFVVLIAILVVGLSSAVLVDRPTANSYLDRLSATEYARMGVDTVVGELRCHSAAFANSGSGNWVSFPGGLVVSATGAYTLDQTVSLNSGTGTGAAGDLAEPNLNVATFRDPANALLTGSRTNAPVLSLAWIYVRQDGTIDTAQPPVKNDTANPIVGRFAYWTDDESSKVNYNLAWTRSSTNPAPSGHPTTIELSALDGFSGSGGQAFANAIHGAITASGSYQFFNTPEDARRVELISVGAASALHASKFDVTHYNHDPNTTFFNEPRIVLTTQPKLAGWTFNTNPAYPNQWVGVNGLPSSEWSIVDGKLSGGGRPVFLDIVEYNSSGNPIASAGWNVWNPFETVSGTAKVIPDAKITRTLHVLNSYLRRADWPMAPGSSFQARYFAGSPERLTQLSLNIIDYVRTKEYAGDPVTNTGIVVPIRGSLSGTTTATTDTTTFSVVYNPGGTNLFLGTARIPKITEVGIWIEPTPYAGLGGTPATYPYKWKVKVELYLPPNYGIPKIDLTKLNLLFQYFDDSVTGTSPKVNETAIQVSEISDGNPDLYAGSYKTITRSINSQGIRFLANPRPVTGTVFMRFGLSLAQGSSPPRLELVPFVGGKSEFLQVPYNSPGTAETNIDSLEVDDPRVNTHKDNWLPHVGSGNSFGSPNSISTLGKAPSAISPQQDTGGGVISAASLYMPPPPKAGADTSLGENPGYVTSAGELGYIHTGMESTKAGVPWRTLRLQPNSQPVSEVPDWAFMDLFTAPVGAAQDADYAAKQFVYAPHATAIAGRVNVNSRPEPFALDREGPLAAVLQGASYDSSNLSLKLSASQARNIAAKIYAHQLGTAGKTYGNAAMYDSSGEIVEIAGVADSGEKSEELFRQISNNVTARGNVFTVYGVGQAVKQSPSGTLKVLAEQRVQAMIERVASNGKIQFATIYFRTLTP